MHPANCICSLQENTQILQVCLVNSYRPESTIDRTLSREPPPIAVLVHYIPENPVLRYPIHRTNCSRITVYRVQIRTLVVRFDPAAYANGVEHSSFLSTNGGKSHSDCHSGHLVGYIILLGIELETTHVTISPMFVISYFLFFWFSFLLFLNFFSFFFLISIIS